MLSLRGTSKIVLKVAARPRTSRKSSQDLLLAVQPLSQASPGKSGFPSRTSAKMHPTDLPGY